jgi:hypothetical protein
VLKRHASRCTRVGKRKVGITTERKASELAINPAHGEPGPAAEIGNPKPEGGESCVVILYLTCRRRPEPLDCGRGETKLWHSEVTLRLRFSPICAVMICEEICDPKPTNTVLHRQLRRARVRRC